jgi:hypothetical protein
MDGVFILFDLIKTRINSSTVFLDEKVFILFDLIKTPYKV